MPEVAVKTRDQTRPAVATSRRVDLSPGSDERTAGVAADQIQFILRQDWFQPETLKKYIAALKNWQPNQLSVIIDGQIFGYNRIINDLQRFIQSLPPDRRQNLTLDRLDLIGPIIDEVAGSAASAEAAQPPSPNVPKDLKALVAEFETAHQAAVSAQAKRLGWSPEKFREQIALQNQITIQMGVVRQATLSQLGLVIDNSQYLENLAAALGRQPEVVKRLAKIRLQTLVDKSITAQTFRQARLISQDPSQLAGLFTKNLSDNLKLDDLVGMAAATNQKNYKKAVESVKNTVTEETEKVKPAIQSAAENLENHPSVQKAAQQDAVAAVKQVKPDIPPAKAARLNQQLVRHQDNPSVQEKIIAGALKVSPAQAKIIRGQLVPQISQLAASTRKLNPLLAADPDSIAADALRRPNLFPKPLVDAIKSGKITDVEVADIFHTARLLDIPVNAVILTRFGVNAQNLAANLQTGKKWLGIIPMDHGLNPQDASVVKLSHLADAQQQFIKSLQSPPPLLPDHTAKQFLHVSRAAARSVRLNQFFDQINPFHVPRIFSYNLGRIPPLGNIGTAGSSFISGLRVQSAPINSFFNFISSAGNAVRQAPSFLTAPFRAVGGLVNQGWQNVKTWAGTQVKSGLAKAGAWLAKKGITEGAKKLGAAIIGKGTAALLAQAVPVVGQIAGVLMLLSTLGDIGKFLWEHKKEIGIGLGGMFLLGQLLLGKLLGFLSSLGTLGLTTGIGALIGTFIFPGIGTAIGAGLGFGAGLMINAAGGLGAVLSGLGSALGSAAASLSSSIGALTAPSAFIGLGSTVATAGLLGVAAAWFLQTFFIQPNINSALFVPPDEGTFAPGSGYIPPEVLGSCPIPGGVLLCGSFTDPNSPYCQHGDNSYWGGGRTPCSWPIPLSDPGNCTYNSALGSVCNRGNNSCPWYGFAADFHYTPAQCNLPVYLPPLNGQSLNWTVVDGGTWASGKWGMLRATDGTTVYEMLFGHLIEQPVGGPSGTKAGMLLCGPNHLHVELRINGEYVRPDSLCPGTGFIIASPTPTPPPGLGPGRR